MIKRYKKIHHYLKGTHIEKRWKREVWGLGWAFLFAMIIRTFLYQPFSIPSGSMIPTLLVGDFLFVSKTSYGYSNYSFPFYPNVMKGRAFRAAPKRGDVAVFFNPKDRDLDYIKRIVGMPGDKLQVIDGVIHVNGKPFKREYIGDFHNMEQGRLVVSKKYRETNADGVSYIVLKSLPAGVNPYDNTPEYTVPEGHYFMMGDNRDNSQDSRSMQKVGFIPEERFIGRADLIFWSTTAKWYDLPQWIFGLRLERVMTLIK